MKVGIWVEAEGKNRPFRSKDEFDSFREFIREQPFTDFYCQVFREGRAWFQTEEADTSPFELAQSFGVDPLRETIQVAHAQGKRVHAWINVLRVDRVSGQTAIQNLGPDAVLTDNFGNSMLTYNDSGAPVQHSLSGHRIDTPGIWLDPSSSKVRAYIVRVVEQLIDRYPDLDGIHLDMIRFPFSVGGGGLSYPYGIAASEEFQKIYGRLPPKPTEGGGDSVLRRNWDDWRRAQITRLVFDIKQTMNAKRPTMELSAAVLAFPDRAFRSAFQDWQTWLRGAALDYAVPMNYTRDLGVFRNNARFAVGSRQHSRVQIGIGAWLMSGEPELFNAQLDLARKEGADGVVLFSYSNLFSARGREFLRRVMAPFRRVVEPPREVPPQMSATPVVH
ncbi:MAG: family 10 glycosylhydrolase [Bdellovibrionota bacterium]